MSISDLLSYVLVAFCAWFLTWIFSQPPIYPESTAHAQQVCAENGGWAFIEEGRNRFASVTCENGAEFSYDARKLLEKKQ